MEISGIEWLRDVNWMLSLAAAIPLSIIANLLTPKLQNWFAQRSTRKAKERREELEKELSNVEQYKKDKIALLFETVVVTLKVIVYIGIGNAITSIPFTYLVADPIGAIIYLIGIMAGIKHLMLISKINRFEEYKNTILTEQKVLQSKENA